MEGFERIADHTMTEPEVRAAFRAQIDREEIIGSLRGSMPELAEAQLPALADRVIGQWLDANVPKLMAEMKASYAAGLSIERLVRDAGKAT